MGRALMMLSRSVQLIMSRCGALQIEAHMQYAKSVQLQEQEPRFYQMRQQVMNGSVSSLKRCRVFGWSHFAFSLFTFHRKYLVIVSGSFSLLRFASFHLSLSGFHSTWLSVINCLCAVRFFCSFGSEYVLYVLERNVK